MKHSFTFVCPFVCAQLSRLLRWRAVALTQSHVRRAPWALGHVT